jgi:PTH2 family peptidyl-tRNA hydrolase
MMNSERFPKQVIVIRRDLKMRRGKEIAQGSHASMAFLSRQLQAGGNTVQLTDEAKQWMEKYFTKICLQVDTEAELLEVYQNAKDKGLEVHLITDSGRTEFNGVPTNTCLAIGPNYADRIDEVTAHLKLY